MAEREVPGVMLKVGTFVALGDSFTEGLGDPYPDGTGRYRGWADRFAQRLAADQPGLRYANLAVRGKLTASIVAEQVPPAIAMTPDLVSLAAGGNDLLRPWSSDPDAVAETFDRAVSELRAAGCEVIIFTGFDPGMFPLIRLIRGKAAAYSMHLRAIADRSGCHLVDLWSMRVLGDSREWSADRLHMSPDGHRRVSLRVCEVMGLHVEEDWREPLPPRLGEAAVSGSARWLAARRMDARWTRDHAAPWFARRLRGVNSDGLPKRPELLPL
jgi:lysophospholipase L1-like esterase